MKICKNAFVTLTLCVTDTGGQVVDDGKEPVRYLHGGYGGMLAKLEEALEGKDVGDRVDVTLVPADAFGEHDPALVVDMPLEAFQEMPAVGDILERTFADTTLNYRVAAVDGEKAVLDGNHPLAGATLTFSATVTEVSPAGEEEVSAEIKALEGVSRELHKTELVRARANAAVEEEMEAAVLARAEAAGLVQSTYVPQLGMRVRFVFRSQTHKLCWLALTLLLPVPVAWLGSRGQVNAAIASGLVWLLWSLLSPWLIGRAIDRWGYRLLFFDFSPNLTPTVLERRIVTGGEVASVLVVVAFTVVALFPLDHLSDLLILLGTDFLVLCAAIIPFTIVLPLLVMLATGFRVRPVIDKPVTVAKPS